MAESLRERTLETQRDIFRLADLNHGLERKIIASKSGIRYDALGTYARGEHLMGIVELNQLCDVVPDYLLSRLLDPVGRHLASNEKQDGDLSELGREAANFTSAYVEAVSDGKVTPIEKAKLTEGAQRLRSAASSVVGDAAA